MGKRKKQIPLFEDHLQGRYHTATNNTIWCIDATYVSSGNLLLLVDLASRLILGHIYLHGHKSNEFQAEHVCLLIQKCYFQRKINEQDPINLTVHSDQGKQFLSEQFEEFCEAHKITKSITARPRGNQVIESINASIKNNIRLRVDPSAHGFKHGSFADPLRKLSKMSEQEINNAIEFAIAEHNGKTSYYNKQFSPNEMDTALTIQKQIQKPEVLYALNDDSEQAKQINFYKENVVLAHGQTWADFFAKWRVTQKEQFEQTQRRLDKAEHERAKLLSKIDLQYELLKNQEEQIQKLIDELNSRLELERQRELRKIKRKQAKKMPPRDTINPKEFQSLIQSIQLSSPKYARIKVAFTLLYLTGLRVTNLLTFNVQNIVQLQQDQSTLIHLIKRGGMTKIAIPNDAKTWLKQIQPDISLLIKGKGPQDALFTNNKGQIISRSNFNKDLNKILKDLSIKSGKRLYTHSFRVTMITELLQSHPIQQVKKLIGHKDIRTTEVYDRKFMSERELRKALQFVYKNRKQREQMQNNQDNSEE